MKFVVLQKNFSNRSQVIFALHRHSNHLSTMQRYLAYFRGAKLCPVLQPCSILLALCSMLLLHCSAQNSASRCRLGLLRGHTVVAEAIFHWSGKFGWVRQTRLCLHTTNRSAHTGGSMPTKCPPIKLILSPHIITTLLIIKINYPEITSFLS